MGTRGLRIRVRNSRLFIANCFPFARSRIRKSTTSNALSTTDKSFKIPSSTMLAKGKQFAIKRSIKRAAPPEFHTSDTKPTASGCALSPGRRVLAPGCGAALRRSTLRTRAHARSGAKEACLVCSARLVASDLHRPCPAPCRAPDQSQSRTFTDCQLTLGRVGAAPLCGRHCGVGVRCACACHGCCPGSMRAGGCAGAMCDRAGCAL